MGGTSFDICLVRDGRPEIKTDWNWRYRYYIGLPMVDVQSVGAGGGSIARVRQGALLVGPESAGSTPGPACYGRGGTRADRHRRRRGARLPARRRLRGRAHARSTSTRRAPRSQRDVAEPLGIDVDRSGVGHRAHRERQHGERDPQGARRPRRRPARPLADRVRRQRRGARVRRSRAELGIDRILVPKAAPAFSALGVLVADYVVDLVRSYVTPLSQVDLGRVRDADDRAARRGRQGARADRARRRPTSRRTLYAQMCYPGQNFDMSVPVPEGTALDEPGLLDLAERFHDQHEAERGFCFRNQQPLAARRARHRARAARRSPTTSPRRGTVSDATQAPQGHAAARTSATSSSTRPVYDGAALGAGRDASTGPALDRGAVHRRRRCRPARPPRLDDLGNYDISL